MSRVDEALARALRDSQRTEPRSPLAGPYPAAVPAAMPVLDDADAMVEESTAAPKLLESAATPASGSVGASPRLIDQIDEQTTQKLVIGPTANEAVEQYRQLAATLHQAQEKRGIKTLLIVSAAPAEGKTLTASNLALTLSESYRRDVLLIDADLRRPSVDGVFQLAPGDGLTEGLKRPDKRQIAVRRVSEFLSILPAGLPDADPMEMLTSDRMRQLLREAASTFDWVIIDTPPVTLLPDANLLATFADAALLVVRAGVTPYALVKRAIDAVGRPRLIGMVLNGVDPDDLPHGEYYYGYKRPGGKASK